MFGEGPGEATAGMPGQRGGQPGHTRAVYLAHPIDHGYYDVTGAVDALSAVGCAVYVPSRAWKVPPEGKPTRALQDANNAVIDLMDGVLALLPTYRLTVGTVLEVVRAARNHQPVVIVSDMNPSWALAEFDVPVYAELQDAIAELTRRMEA